MNKNNGGPAFPSGMDGEMGQDGMSLRDWFAGQAMTGYIAWSPNGVEDQGDPRDLAKFVYSVADAMLEARGK